MKDFHCRDAGANCDFVARGQNNAEIMKQVGQHSESAHQMKVSPEMAKKIEGLIHDENSDAHRQSTTRR